MEIENYSYIFDVRVSIDASKDVYNLHALEEQVEPVRLNIKII